MRVSLALLLALSTIGFCALPPEVADLKSKRDAKVAEINTAYVTALQKIQKKSMAAGDLDGANDVQKEIDSLTNLAVNNSGVGSITEASKLNPILGKWLWGPTLVVEFTDDGKVKGKGYDGKWTENKTSTVERKYTVSWNDGSVVDEVTVNGRQARCKNSQGLKFNSEKLPAKPNGE